MFMAADKAGTAETGEGVRRTGEEEKWQWGTSAAAVKEINKSNDSSSGMEKGANSGLIGCASHGDFIGKR